MRTRGIEWLSILIRITRLCDESCVFLSAFVLFFFFTAGVVPALRIISLKLKDVMSFHKFVSEFEIELKFLIYEILNQKY